MKLVIHPAVEPERLARLRAAAPTAAIVNAQNEAEARAHIADADAFWGKLTPPLLAAAAKLRWVQAFTVSLEHYVFPELIAHPCVLTNMRGLFSDVIADQVMGCVVCFARNLHTYIRNQVERRWSPVGGEENRVHFASGPGVVTAIDRAHPHLGDQTLGVFGYGQIGMEIARRARAFGMRVLAVDVMPRAGDDAVESVWPENRLPDLLNASDYAVIAAPHTPRTEKLFRLPLLERMKPSAYLINIGRGAIVELSDLVEALRRKLIAGAALDVFEKEPLPADHPLWDFPNVILTPHVAGYSPRIAGRHFEVLLDNLQRFERGVLLRNVVDKAAWY